MDTADAVAKARARAPLVDILFRMSLRSVAANAKWVRKIFVVTDSPPSWLLSGAAGGRVTVVPTSAIMPADHLPTFNSHAVEANLHKVPGLSECYVYMNADYFFGRPSSLADFVDLEKGQYKIILEMDRTSAAASQLSRPPASHDAAFRNANMLLDGWAIANSNKGIERHFVPHAPHFFRKSLVEQLAAKAATQFSATSSHRFRSFEDVHVAYLHAYCAHPRRADLRTFPFALSALSRAPAYFAKYARAAGLGTCAQIFWSSHTISLRRQSVQPRAHRLQTSPHTRSTSSTAHASQRASMRNWTCCVMPRKRAGGSVCLNSSRSMTRWMMRCGNRHLFLSFPYVCPEPVLAK
eukprot:COSAG06_NODE_698_length_12975_cov_108.592575_12_plen_352_part_00